MDELEVKRETRTALLELQARDGFLARYCPHLPAIYRAGCPFTTSARELLDWKGQAEREWAEDVAAFHKRDATPWVHSAPQARHLDWSGVTAQEKLSIGFESEGFTLGPDVALPANIRFGEGIDSRDGQRKAFSDFVDVDERRRRGRPADAAAEEAPAGV